MEDKKDLKWKNIKKKREENLEKSGNEKKRK